MKFFNRCKHTWIVKGWVIMEIFRQEYGRLSEIPHRYETHATLVCSKCGQIDTQIKLGKFADPRGNV